MGVSSLVVIINAVLFSRTVSTLLFTWPDSYYEHKEFYVSKSGTTNHTNCGDRANPCATLHDLASVKLFTYSEAIDIYIVDGQNESRIMENMARHNDTTATVSSHPCLLPPDGFAVTLNIIFNSSAIRDLNDWFPRSICVDPSYPSISNEYMFNHATHLKLHNLMINDYSMDSLGIAYSRDLSGSVNCYNCTFINVVSNKALLYSWGSIHLTNAHFDSIHTVGDIMVANHYFETVFTTDHDLQRRAITIEDGMFVNISSNASLIHITAADGAAPDLYVVVNLTITNTQFSEISTGLYVVNDESNAATVVMCDIFLNISTGCVYRSAHTISGAIAVHNILLLTNALTNEREDPLFSFTAADITTIYNMNVSYLYDAYSLCGPEPDSMDPDDDFGFGTIGWDTPSLDTKMLCKNRTPLIENGGQIVMNDIDIDVDVVNESPNTLIQSPSSSHNTIGQSPKTIYRYETSSLKRTAFIQNRNSMEINHMFVSRTIAYTFISNTLHLVIRNSRFDNHVTDDVLDPNALTSDHIVMHSGELSSTLHVHNSYFAGSTFQIHVEMGTVEIFRSMFEHSSHAIQIHNADSVTLKHCEMKNMGPSYGILIFDTDDVQMTHNLFSSYDPPGLLYLSDNSQISLTNNTFIISEDATYYRNPNDSALPSAQEIDYSDWYSSLTIIGSDYVTMMYNDFVQNIVDPTTPWVYFSNAHVCLAHNVFNNTALGAQWSNITSCFRPQMSVCALYLSTATDQLQPVPHECSDGVYGNMDRSLYNQQNTFIARDNLTALISAYHSTIALDNVNIIFANNGANTVFATLSPDSILLLVDAYMDGMPAAYNEDSSYRCTVTYNDRLQSDSDYISRFLMDCSDQTNGTNVTLTHYPIHLVHQLNIAKLKVFPASELYYPGDWLAFTYQLTDRMGQIINNNSLTATINLLNPRYVLIEPLYIENGSCLNCDRGVLITDILMSAVGQTYEMTVEVDDRFILEHDTLNLSIIGCPVGYSPDPNAFLCQQCNTDYYSLSANNTEKCMPCDPDTNTGVTCIDGMISVSYNNWMGLDEELIISARCPDNFCCANKAGCHYDDLKTMNKNRLCARNRDDTSTLCGRCLAGYSETLRSTQCVKCGQPFYIKPIIYPILLALLWALGLVILSSDKKKKKRSSEAVGIRAYLSNPNFIMMNRILLTRNIIYYQQAVSQILSSNPFMAFFVGLTQIFNLSVTRNEADSVFAECFVDGMNGKGKILMDLLMPGMVLLFIIIAHIASICLEHCVPVLFAQRKHNFPKCYSAAFVLMIGNILSVLFRLMHCQPIGPYHVHYYFGDEICFERTWIVCLLALLSIIGVFVAIMVRLKRIGNKERSNRSSAWNIFVDKYKPQCFWWEFVLFIRRICIAMFSVSFNDHDSRVVFCMVILIFLGLQWKYEPFIVQSANWMECWLLLAVVMIIMMEAAQNMNPTFKSIVVLLLVLLPFALMAYYVALFVKRKQRDDFSLSLLKKRVMYLFLCVMMHYAPTRSKAIATSTAAAQSNEEDDIQVVYNQDEEIQEVVAKVQSDSEEKVEINDDTVSDILEFEDGTVSDEFEFEEEESAQPSFSITGTESEDEAKLD